MRSAMARASLVGVVLILCASPLGARGDARVSFEVGGLMASSPVDGTALPTGVGRSALRLSTGPSAGTPAASLDSISAFEIRPTFNFDSGAQFAVGFRAGQTGAPGDSGGIGVYGGDVSLGYSRRYGRLLPFGQVRFGLNSYDLTYAEREHAHSDQLRLDAVVGSRVYVAPALFFAGSAFAGFGDHYGGAIALGFDVVHFRARGLLP